MTRARDDEARSMTIALAERWPVPADFPAAPTKSDRRRWTEADREARPVRLARLRDRMAREGVEGYYGVRLEHARYLTGFATGDGEEKVAGASGQFLVGREEIVLFADSRYEVQAGREAPDARLARVYHDLPDRWPELVASIGARRVAVEASFVSQAVWTRLAAATPDIELVPVEGWLEEDRATKERAEIERIGAACTVADRALAAVLPEIQTGRSERELALALEWRIRSDGADGLAFDVACLFGPEAALPHGSPGDRQIHEGAVLLVDFGAQVDGYRSDMTRTLFVGDPTPRDLEIYELVAAAQSAAIGRLEAGLRDGTPVSGREVDAAARARIEAAGHGDHFGHGTGHGIGLATHELPTLGTRSPTAVLPSPTVFSVEPGVYLASKTGVRIEDLVVYDTTASRLTRLTQFPRDIVIVGR